jgi:beta-galactosidase
MAAHLGRAPGADAVPEAAFHRRDAHQNEEGTTMRTIPSTRRRLAAALLMAIAACPALAEVRSLSQEWLFHAGEAAGAERTAFDDRSWHRVVVPHDFSIMDRPDGSPPFDPATVSGQDSGYLPGGIWPSRRPRLPASSG